ncbi:MAG: hypothetical protein HZA62_12780 [Rhodocyclales bacterium]|nr:hypothetical protein [Rhodocyclales bacterium]
MIVLVFCFGVTGAALAQQTYTPVSDYVSLSGLRVASRFATVELTRDTLAIEANRCIPALGAKSQNIQEALSGFPNRNSIVFGHVNSAKKFLVRQTTGMCLAKSSAGHPVFATEAFIDTVNPVGVPPDVVDEWYRQIALLIATKGAAKVAYTFPNGNAFVVSYWVDSSPEFGLYYSNQFRKTGNWEYEALDTRLSHSSMRSVSETQRSGASQKEDPISHRYK